MLSSALWLCGVVLLSTVHTGCFLGVRWVTLLMSFPKGTVSNKRILGSVPKSLLKRLQHREVRSTCSAEEGTLSSLTLFRPVPAPKLPLWGVLQAGAGWAHVREVSSLLAAQFDIPADIKPDASERLCWYTLLILPLQMPWWCVKGHTLKRHKLEKR